MQISSKAPKNPLGSQPTNLLAFLSEYTARTPRLTVNALRFSQYKSLPDDEGERCQLRPGGPDGRPAVGGGEHPAVRGGQLQDHSDGTGQSVVSQSVAGWVGWRSEATFLF